MTTPAPDPAPDSPRSGFRAAWERKTAKPSAGSLFAGRAPRMALFLALAFFVGLLWRPALRGPLGTDSLIYHLSIPALWLQEGFLSSIDLPFDHATVEHSPMLSQIVTFLLMSITGDGGLAWLVQPACLLLICRLFYLSARLIGLGRGKALTLCALLLLFPPFINSSLMVNNELVMTLGFALFAWGLLAARLVPARALVCAGGGIALMLATKVVGALYSAPALLALLAVFVGLLRAAGGAAERRKLCLAGTLALVLMVCGCSFYFRNWALHGNPLYPAQVSIAGGTIFPGLYDASVLVDHGWAPRVFFRTLVHDDNAFAPKWRFTVLLWLGFAFSLVLLAARRGRSRRGRAAALPSVLFPILALLLYFAFVPFWHQHRLLFPVYYALWLALAGALAGFGRLWPRPRARSAVKWGLLLMVAVNLAVMAAKRPEFWLAGPVAALLAFLGRPPRSSARLLRWAPAALLLLTAVTAPAWYPAYRAARERRRIKVYAGISSYEGEGRMWADLDRMAAKGRGRGRALTVAYVGTPHIFPLFGPRLQNRVVYVPASADDRPQPVKLRRGDSPRLMLARARRARFDEAFWLRGIERADVDLLCLVNDPKVGGIADELAAIRRHPRRFKLLFRSESGRASVYRVSKTEESQKLGPDQHH